MDFNLNGLEMRDFRFLNIKGFCTRMQDGDGSGGGPEADFCSTNSIFFIQVTDANFSFFAPSTHILLYNMMIEPEILFHKIVCDPCLRPSLFNTVVTGYM